MNTMEEKAVQDKAFQDKAFMERALQLAKRGAGYVSPNPLVGCVIVSPQGTVLGEGWYERFGGPHAEVNAVRDAENHNNPVEGSTVYVTLEPHAHFGKTPPCTDLLIRNRISRCVIGTLDSNPKVSGHGVEQLKNAGIEVTVGVLEEKAKEVTRFFLKHITTGVPYVTLKIASSIDGKVALKSGEARWITSEASRKLVHQMRAEHDAVLIGKGTALRDDPTLTVRNVEGRDPYRIILDSQLSLPRTLKLFNDENKEKTFVLVTKKVRDEKSDTVTYLENRGIKVLPISSGKEMLELEEVLKEIGSQNITSVLVEPGSSLAGSFFRSLAFDELALFLAPKVLGGDATPSVGPLSLEYLSAAPQLQLYSLEQVKGSEDILVRYRKP